MKVHHPTHVELALMSLQVLLLFFWELFTPCVSVCVLRFQGVMQIQGLPRFVTISILSVNGLSLQIKVDEKDFGRISALSKYL